MSIDHNKLRSLADSLTEDQRQLLREGIGSGANPSAADLSETLKSFDQDTIHALSTPAPLAEVSDGGTDGGTTTVSDGGTTTVRPEPPLTRW